MPVPDQPAESENASTGDRTESEAASAILASVKEQVGTQHFSSVACRRLRSGGRGLGGHTGDLNTFVILISVSGLCS
ncbi:catenin delta-2 isoform X1 [Tachysurus ichikawai]